MSLSARSSRACRRPTVACSARRVQYRLQACCAMSATRRPTEARPTGRLSGLIACAILILLLQTIASRATTVSSGGRRRWRAARLGVVRDTVAERPVLLGHLDQIDEHVLAAQAGVGGEPLDDAPVERLLLLFAAGVAHRQLDDHKIVAARDAEIVRGTVEVLVAVLGHEHEAVVLGHVEGLAQCLVDAVENDLPVGGSLAALQVDACEGHGGSPGL